MLPTPRSKIRSIIDLDAQPALEWKNGRGSTREVAAFSDSADASAFLWRVSIAEIAENAPFSTFAGIDRHFLVAIGSCVHLSIGSAERKLRRGEQASFTGEDVVAARVRETPARCLNLMTRRGFCEGGLTVRHHDGRVSLDATAVAVILLEGGAMTSDGQPLEPMQAIILGSQPEEVSFAQAVVAVVHVRRTAASAY